MTGMIGIAGVAGVTAVHGGFDDLVEFVDAALHHHERDFIGPNLHRRVCPPHDLKLLVRTDAASVPRAVDVRRVLVGRSSKRKILLRHTHDRNKLAVSG